MCLQVKGQGKLLRGFRGGWGGSEGAAHRNANGPPPTASSSISIGLLHSLGLFNSSAGPSAAAAAEITPFKKSARRPPVPRRELRLGKHARRA